MSGRPLAVHIITRFARGGSERRLLDMVQATDGLDHHVMAGSVLALDEARERLGPATLEVLPTLVRRPGPIQDLRALLAIRRRLRALGPDVVVTHQSKAGALGRIVAAGCGVPAVHSLSMASFGPGYPVPVRALYRAVERSLVARTAAYVAVGSDLADAYAALGVPRDRLHVVRSAAPLPSPPDDRHAARRSLLACCGAEPDRPVIAYVGSLDGRKNLPALVDIAEGVVSRCLGPAPLLAIAGDGPARRAVERDVAERGLHDHVRLLGHVADPAPVFRGADVVLLASRAEGLPQVLVQAAAAATPFVAFAVSGTGELLRAGAQGTEIPWGRTDLAVDAVLAHLRHRDGRCRELDLTSWDPAVVHEGHAAVLAEVLGRPVREGVGADVA